MIAKHTPTPWTAWDVVDVHGRTTRMFGVLGHKAVGRVEGRNSLASREADRDFIVEAANSYEALQSRVGALERALREVRGQVDALGYSANVSTDHITDTIDALMVQENTE